MFNPLKNCIPLRQSAFRLDVGDSTRNLLPSGLVISQSFLNSGDAATLLLALDLLRQLGLSGNREMIAMGFPADVMLDLSARRQRLI